MYNEYVAIVIYFVGMHENTEIPVCFQKRAAEFIKDGATNSYQGKFCKTKV